MSSLHEQLLKAGLIDESKANKAAQEQRKKTHQKTAKAQKKAKKQGELVVDETKVLVEQARQTQKERSQALNRKQREAAEQRAIQAQIRQLINLNRIDYRQGEIPYQFADHNKVKRILLTDKLHEQLADGMIALVKLDENYELVPRQIAEKITQRDTHCVLVANTRHAQPLAEEDDPYADFKIPDDLMW
ncbi:MAG: nucleoprotein/polynucleotide-associated enzyme [Proteobacteria bacterium]|nr:MAG: nucleoprotein/polynucleotide-associated enzyme [Pseudomonadota bacterium]